MPEIKLIVGLGNPGAKYEDTRHNVGFQSVDRLAVALDAGWKNWPGPALIAGPESGGKAALLKPQDFMNNSGAAVSAYSRYLKILPEEILVVVDDFSLPLGAVRLRLKGSDGGHNGLASIVEHLSTKNFPRLRLGIGPVPDRMDPADYVLSRFKAEEREKVGAMVKAACDIMGSILAEGLEKTMSRMPKMPDNGAGE